MNRSERSHDRKRRLARIGTGLAFALSALLTLVDAGRGVSANKG